MNLSRNANDFENDHKVFWYFSPCGDASQDAGVNSSAPFDLGTTDTCLAPLQPPHPPLPAALDR